MTRYQVRELVDRLERDSSACLIDSIRSACCCLFLDVVVHVSPQDIVLKPDEGQPASEFLCTISGQKESILAFLTGASSPSELLSSGSGSFAIAGEPGALDRILTAFNLSLSAYTAFSRKNAYDLETPDYGPTGASTWSDDIAKLFALLTRGAGMQFRTSKS